MTDIIVLENGGQLSRHIADILSENYFVRFFNGESLRENGEGYMLDILSVSELPDIRCHSCAVVLSEGAAAKRLPYSRDIPFIASSAQTAQIAALDGRPVITCGSYEKDTVSYTSISDENMTVALNRELVALSGKHIQPLEFPIKRGADIYPCLAATALRLLLDDFDSDLGRLL